MFDRKALLINKLPKQLQRAICRYSSLVALIASIYVLMGYRLESYRAFGIAALVLLAPLLCIYFFALTGFKKEDIPRGHVIFTLCTLLIFLCIAIIFLAAREEEKVRLFEEMSPWPMVVVFIILYAIQAVAIQRRRSRETP
jgi:hypothetical protein